MLGNNKMTNLDKELEKILDESLGYYLHDQRQIHPPEGSVTYGEDDMKLAIPQIKSTIKEALLSEIEVLRKNAYEPDEEGGILGCLEVIKRELS